MSEMSTTKKPSRSQQRRSANRGRRPRAVAPTEAAEATENEGILDWLLRLLRHRRWILLQAIIIVPAVVAALTFTQEKRYTATSSVLIQAAPPGLTDQTTQAFTDPEREEATNQRILGLPTLADRAARRLPGVSANEIFSSVSVASASSNDVLDISAESTGPRRAAAIANAYAAAFIAFRQQTGRAQIDTTIRALQRRLAGLDPISRAGTQGSRLQSRLNDLEFTRSLQTGNADLVQRATPPGSPSSPKVKRNLALGIILGLILGIALAALLERLDPAIKETDELEDIYGVPILTHIPRSRELGKQSVASGEMLGARGVEAEAFRMLRANLRFYNVDRDIVSLLVASPVAGEGKSTVARNLAVTMAGMGDEVILVEADLHKRGITGELNSRRTQSGLSDVLAGEELDDAFIKHPVGDRELTILPSGLVPPNPSELLDSERMAWALERLEERFDLVIIDSPPLSVVSDVLSLVPKVSGVLIVSRLGRTPRPAAQELRKRLRRLGGRVLGSWRTGRAPPRRDTGGTTTTPSDAVSALATRGDRVPRLLLLGAIVLGGLAFEVVVGAAVVKTQFVPIAMLVTGGVVFALIAAFPVAALGVFVVLTASVLSGTRAVHIGPVGVRAHELLLIALLVVAVIRPRRRDWGGVAGLALAVFLGLVVLSAALAVTANKTDVSSALSWSRPFFLLAVFWAVLRLVPDELTARRMLFFAGAVGAATALLAVLIALGSPVVKGISYPGDTSTCSSEGGLGAHQARAVPGLNFPTCSSGWPSCRPTGPARPPAASGHSRAPRRSTSCSRSIATCGWG